jgi:two-component system, NtrC family, sensor histidine kinase GlrK
MTPKLTPPDDNRPLYPGSFFRFLVVAFVLVSTPLVIGLVQLTAEADGLAKRSEETVRNVSSIVQDVQAMQAAVSQMERIVRQSIALGEPPALEAYGGLRAQFLQIADRLSKARLPPNMTAQLREVMSNEAALVSGLRATVVLADVPAEMDSMDLGLEALAEAGTAAAAIEIENIRQQVVTSKNHAMVIAAVAIPLAVLLAVLFTVLLARPIGRIDRAINRMGAGHLDDSIHIGGPQDVRLLGQRLDWLRVRLKELEAERALLSQSLSHDLKTPLTSIHEGTDLLLQGVAGPLNPRQDEIVQIMRQSVHAMSGNIEGLLTVRSGALRDAPVALEPIELRALVASVLSQHELSSRTKQLTLDVEGPELHLNGDRAKLRIVFDNLLSNAIRFSPNGGRVLFALSAVAGVARIQVSDEGEGLTEEDAGRVFEPGFRARDQPTPGVPGSGVGLTITREFVMAHGGEIRIDAHGSELNLRGARFVIEMPGLTQNTSPSSAARIG